MPGRRISFCWMRHLHYSFMVPYDISQLALMCAAVRTEPTENRCDTENYHVSNANDHINFAIQSSNMCVCVRADWQKQNVLKFIEGFL